MFRLLTERESRVEHLSSSVRISDLKVSLFTVFCCWGPTHHLPYDHLLLVFINLLHHLLFIYIYIPYDHLILFIDLPQHLLLVFIFPFFSVKTHQQIIIDIYRFTLLSPIISIYLFIFCENLSADYYWYSMFFSLGTLVRGPTTIIGKSPMTLAAQANQRKLSDPGGGTFRWTINSVTGEFSQVYLSETDDSKWWNALKTTFKKQ